MDSSIGGIVGGDELRESDNVVHYVRPRLVLRDGGVSGEAFRLRADERGLSVNWLECFNGTKLEQIAEVRALLRIETRTNGRLAELNVLLTIKQASDSLVFERRPLPADGSHPPDPSHCEITGMPPYESPQSALIGDLIAKCVTETHWAKLS